MNSSFFTGGVFSKQLEDGRESAQIFFSPEAIIARTQGGKTFTLRYDECDLEMGGASGRMVFCRNPDRSLTIFCEDRRFLRALAEEGGEELAAICRALLRRHHLRRFHHLSILLVCVVALIVALVIGYYGIMAGARAVVHKLPMSVDEKIGAAAIQSMDLMGEPVDDAVVTDTIQQIVDRLAPHSAVPNVRYRVQVVHAPFVNAFALPGGNIVVYTGLIEQAKSPEQLAGILAHEMSHVTMRHGMERIAQSMGVTIATEIVFGDTGGLVALGGEVLKTTTVNAYSRNQEAEADAEGVRMLHAAGIDPMGLVEFFCRLKEQQGDLPSSLTWISTHPNHEARIAAIRQQLARLPKTDYRPLDLDWNAVVERVRRLPPPKAIGHFR
ncbi:MAG: hypothetical protein KatS3mg105_4294 [Gemmatales bacterium]|nr:MAG: hypothetical protein KatS3mg105_4294 [Gemmatales bacterium]